MTSRQNNYKTVKQVYYSKSQIDNSQSYPKYITDTPIVTSNEHFTPSKENKTFLPKIYCDESKITFPKKLNDPEIFGPPLWFVYHNAAYNYPINPSPLFKERMKYAIISLPVFVTCLECREHATAYIEKHRDTLDEICSSRDNVFKFFVDFHNQVNKRYNKPILSYTEAYNLYSNMT